MPARTGRQFEEVLCQQYHVVVGNPPYIIVQDRKLNAAYRRRYSDLSPKIFTGSAVRRAILRFVLHVGQRHDQLRRPDHG